MRIGGCTVAELKSRMSAVEFERWRQLYLQQPFDDVHLHYRPTALIAQSMSGMKIDDSMDFLINQQNEPVGEDEVPDGMDVLEQMKVRFTEA